MKKRETENKKIGPAMKKVLIILLAGASLAMTHNPRQQAKIIKAAEKGWNKINKENLSKTIKRLYQSKLIDYREKRDGTVSVVLSEEGKRVALIYKLDELKLKKQDKWDKKWRVIIFDIPEYLKKARDGFSQRLKLMGMIQLQKSVFIYPYDCFNEIKFVAETLGVRPFVRFIVAKEIDDELHLKSKFKIR